ncbi:MAG: sulfatase family protein [Mycobacteriales bacterium]
MTRRVRPSWRVGLLLAAALTVPLLPPHPTAEPAAPLAGSGAAGRPNIVFVLTDDQTIDSMTAMPYLRSHPGGHWVEFSNAVDHTPLCCPSRATILSGQYNHVTGVLQNGYGSSFRDTDTIATWLQGAGYRTGLFGKYLNFYPWAKGATYIPPGWSSFVAFQQVGGYFDYDLNVNGRSTHYGTTAADYSTDVLAGKAAEFIRTSTSPFFLYYSTAAPHLPADPAPRHANAFADLTMPRSPNFNEADVSDKPIVVRQLPLLTAAEAAEQDRLRRQQYRSMLAVDEAIAKLVDTLTTAGKLDNTVLVFMTDNSIALGEHRWELKGCAYEECLRTPLLIRFPSSSAGTRTVPAQVSSVDLAATFAELGGARPSIHQDGLSLVPLLKGTASTWPSDVLLEYHKPKRDEFWGLRSPRWKYVEWVYTGEREVYDLVRDPYELQNQAGKAAYAGVQKELAADLARLRRGSHDTAPDVSITAGPAANTSSHTATFSFAADETSARFTCSLDGGAAAACTTGTSYSQLSSGAHSVSVAATDPTGNSGRGGTWRWTIS